MKDNGAPVVLSGVITRYGYGDKVITPLDRNGEKFGQTILNFIFCLTLDSMVPLHKTTETQVGKEVTHHIQKT
jgi:hypothetical protein